MRAGLAILCALIVLAATTSAGQERASETFKRTPVSALNTSGKLQVIELYHPG